MPYSETHQIDIPPITLPVGVTVTVVEVQGSSGLQSVVQITGVTATAKADTQALLEQAFAILMTAASAEGVGKPVFS